MLYPDLTDVAVEVFGGYSPAIPPADLPAGAAQNASDVIFPMGAARTRGGLLSAFPARPGNPSINGLKSYLTATLAQRLMVWDSLGNLWKENPQGTLNLVNSRPYQNLLYEAQTLFSREYQCFFNSKGGFDIPRQFDDTNWDRVSQVGPGLAPQAGDENISVAIAASPNGLESIGPSNTLNVSSGSQVGFLVTLILTGYGLFSETLQVAKSFRVGDQWLVAGVGAGYNGTWNILSCVASPGLLTITYFSNTQGLAPVGALGTASQPYYVVVPAAGAAAPQPGLGINVTIAGAGVAGYNGTWPVRALLAFGAFTVSIAGQFALAASGNGTWVPTGNIPAGLHQVSVAFITRQGFITAPAPPSSWTAAGSKRVIVGNIPTGPPNVQARLLLFTPVIIPPATTGTFFSLPTGSSQIPTSTMLIPDNVTTQVTVDFLDTVLIAGFQAEYLFSQLELGEPSFMLGYNSRTVYLGERARVPNFLNLSFDGGFENNVPNGWTLDNAGNGPGGSSALAGAFAVDWGDAYAITGDGATAIRGKITQSAYQDFLQTAIIAQNTSYSVRVRLARAGTVPTQGVVHINLQSTLGAFTTVGLAVNATALAATYQEFIATLTDVPLGSPPTDLLLQVYVDGTLTNGTVVLIDSTEPFPTNTPVNFSTARFSHAFNPESFDGTTGQVQVRPGDGQQLQAGFPLRNNLYLGKDHYLAYVTDDGVNEPASWALNEVSATIGICGPNAVDWNEEWAVWAERSGMYVCWGSDPVKITPEIQIDASGQNKPNWSLINWTAAYTIWVRIDRTNKRILMGAPINGALKPNIVFVLDYAWLDNAQDIASSPGVSYSAFTGKMLYHGRGRRWAYWNISANAMGFAERLSTGTAEPFFGNNAGNGLIYQQFDASVQPSDNGVAINSFWLGAGVPSPEQEQMLQLGAHRKLCGYWKARAVGAGTLNLSVSTALRTTNLRGYTLSLTPGGDFGRPLNIHGERFYPAVGTNAVGAWFQLEKLILCVKKDAAVPVTGLTQ